MPRPLRWTLAALAGAAVFAALFLLVGWVLLRNSLPQLDGKAVVAGAAAGDLGGRIERDARGVVTVTAPTVQAAGFALGFAHAQDRYFQMDLARRLAAGELSALVGERALDQDKRARLFEFRRLSRQVLANATNEERAAVAAYARGVNAGLDSLASRPWEYWLLRIRPEAWRDEDSVLVIYAMWWNLQYADLERERGRLALTARLRELAASRPDGDGQGVQDVMHFLYPRGTEWDAPDFPTLAAAAAAGSPAPPELPAPERIDLRSLPAAAPAAIAAPAAARSGALTAAPSLLLALLGVELRPDSSTLPGSNNWAVAGARSASGAALIANDMHLGLRLPPVGYQARIRITGEGLDLMGVTLPGAGALVAGSNGHIAWGFTNSYGDWSDLSAVSCDLARNVYDTDAGPREFTLRQETIAVKGGADVQLALRSSPLGLLYSVDDAGRQCLLVRWLATEAEATNLHMLAFNRARTVGEALALAPTIGIPQQNLVVGDREGHIAWSLIGRVPQQDGGPSAPPPLSWRDGSTQPHILDPQLGLLWSANARVVDGDDERVIGNDEAESGAGYGLGARAAQIRDDLLALKQPATPADMLRIQLDDRALFLERWRTLLMGVLDEDALRNNPQRAELRRLAEHWNARASADSVGYRLVRVFHWQTETAAFRMIVTALGLDPADVPRPSQFEGALWRLVTEQPQHLLAAGQVSWRAFLLAQVDATIASLRESCGQLERCAWGAQNRLAIRHPLSQAIGMLAQLLDLPETPMAGDQDMPRVQAPSFGASERFAVSPGHESEAYLQLPGGQSGHPMSTFYRSGFAAWRDGQPTPLLPGPTQHLLLLETSPSNE